MKPIYECLDYLLDHLYNNRFKPEGQWIDFDVDHKVMPDLELNNHHEFKGLIDMLVDDKYAFFLGGHEEELDHYRKRTMITPKGIDFKFNNGYAGKIIRQNAENIRLHNIENSQKLFRRTQNVLLFLVAVGTIVAACY